jgi:hypothetical protein
MARLSVLAKDQLTPECAALAEQAEAFNIHATVLQVLGHCPDMTQAFFQFYLPWHEGGVVAPVIRGVVRLKVAQLNNCFT